MRIRRTAPLVAALLATGTLAACGDDDDDASDTTAAAAATGPAATEMAPATTGMATTATAATASTPEPSAGGTAGSGDAAEAGDIVDTAVAAGDFTTLVAAVQAAGLEETLRGDGPFTVFAPTDDAFASLPEGTVDTLLEDPAGDLTDILSYHVVDGEVLAADLTDGQDVTTLNGATFTVNVADDGAVSITDGAGNEVSVVQADVAATNGVIHVVDGVLLPG